MTSQFYTTSIPNLDPAQDVLIKRRKAREMTADAVRNRSSLGFLAAAELWEQVGEPDTATTCAKMAHLITLVESATSLDIIIPDNTPRK